MGEAGYKRLIVWEKADQLAKEIYICTRSFPREELYGLTSQLRRAGLSVPTNIVEGYARKSRKELQQFLNISLASLAETEYLLKFAFDLKFFEQKDYDCLENLRQEVGNLLWRFIQSINSSG